MQKMSEISIPIGYLTTIRMYPMDFEEFSLAVGISTNTFDYLRECFSKKTTIDDIIHKQMLNLFNTYLVVGRMPKAVNTFIKTNDINQVNQVLAEIDEGYKQDISKYQKDKKLLIQDIYDLIPDKEKCSIKIIKIKFDDYKNIMLCTNDYYIVGTMLQNGTECNLRSCQTSFFSGNLYYELNKFQNECEMIFYFNSSPYRANYIAIYYREYYFHTNHCFANEKQNTFILDIEFAYFNYDY